MLFFLKEGKLPGAAVNFFPFKKYKLNWITIPFLGGVNWEDLGELCVVAIRKLLHSLPVWMRVGLWKRRAVDEPRCG